MPAERFEIPAPRFSIVHPSARPRKVAEIFTDWVSNAVHPEHVEYVLVTDPRWGSKEEWRKAVDDLAPLADKLKVRFFTRENTDKLPDIACGRRGYVAAVNLGAAASRGDVLIVIADDQYSAGDWDNRIMNGVQDQFAGAFDPQARPFAVFVNTGTPDERERRICVLPILSRKRYRDLGHVFYPAYESAFADNDYFEVASRDASMGKVSLVWAPESPLFPHKHVGIDPATRKFKEGNIWEGADEAYLAQNSQYAYGAGSRIFELRKYLQFRPLVTEECEAIHRIVAPPGLAATSEDLKVEAAYQRASESIEKLPLTSPVDEQPVKEQPVFPYDTGVQFSQEGQPPIVAFCTPGESFSRKWCQAREALITAMGRQGWTLLLCWCESSDPYSSRQKLIETVLAAKPRPHYVLWMDDDQICSEDALRRLVAILEKHPDVDVACAWTWIWFEQLGSMVPSCGPVTPANVATHLDPVAFLRSTEPFEVGWTGFPFVLCRTSAFEKLGKWPFRRMQRDDVDEGELGEDISFSLRLRAAGGKIMVDPQAYVGHLKFVEVQPKFAVGTRDDKSLRTPSQPVDSKGELSVDDIAQQNQQLTDQPFTDSKGVTESEPKTGRLVEWPAQASVLDSVRTIQDQAKAAGMTPAEFARALNGLQPIDSKGELSVEEIGQQNQQLTNGRFTDSKQLTNRPVVIAALRVRNEGRWIGRCIRSLVGAVDAVVLLDDGSADNTLEAAHCALNETGLLSKVTELSETDLRQGEELPGRNWLLQQCRDLAATGTWAGSGPRWVLMLDGDEELTPELIPAIRKAVETERCEAFYFGFHYLWNHPHQVRTDGRFGNIGRVSLFRLENARFAPIYPGRKAAHLEACRGSEPFRRHAGEITGSKILHYGYMLREDRIRKFEYYNRIDPGNAAEGEYKHLVLGDIDRFPSSMRTSCGGPLKLQPLPLSDYPRVPWTEQELKDWGVISLAETFPCNLPELAVQS